MSSVSSPPTTTAGRRMRTHRRTNERATPPEEELREGFKRLGYRKLETAAADYWQIRFETLAEAEAARSAVEADPAAAASYPSYESHTGADLRAPDELGSHVRRAPLQTPVVVGTGDGAWYVVRVADRTLTYTTFDQAWPQLEPVLSTYLPEFRLLQDLRGRAEIDFDRDLFERMMKLDETV